MGVVSDPVADMLTRVRNGIRARHTRVEMPSSKLKVEIARILKDEGYIGNYKVAEEGKKKVLRISLRYDTEGLSVISALDRVSKPGRRVYIGKDRVPKVLGGLGVAILTTPRGLMTGKAARRAGVGGELICNVW
ncbi:MAG TPA: 30S ribosomal protein S8 [Terriglobia bacterium]|jgi:small subunit ribosomal protein S8|nr:30S ribosomal protein S8 [Terriglobia bacterium]